MLFRPFLCQFERILEHAIDAVAREGRGLHHRLPSAPFEDASADRRVLALGIFAHHPELDIADLSVGQRRLDPRHKAYGPQVDIKIELTAHRNKQLPHTTVLSAIFAAPREFIPIERNIKLASGGFEDSQPFGNYLFANPVTRNHRDAVGRHGQFLALTIYSSFDLITSFGSLSTNETNSLSSSSRGSRGRGSGLAITHFESLLTSPTSQLKVSRVQYLKSPASEKVQSLWV